MTLFKLPQDRFTWFVLLVVFISAFVSVAFNYHIIRQLQQEQQDFHTENVNAENIIIKNQRDYINCLIGINPKGDIQSQEKVCFNKP